jgi:DNA-binding CsgD family transcriptional regulator
VVRVLLKGLTPREREVALLIERNLSNAEIARRLGIKPGTVKIHVHNIFIKGGLSPRSRRSSNGRKTDAVIERIREAQRRRWQRWRAARSADNT